MRSFFSSSLSVAVALALPVVTSAQGVNPFGVGVDINFRGDPPSIAHEAMHFVQETAGPRLRVVGSRPLPGTGVQQAFAYDAGVFRTLNAPNAFETIAKAAAFDGRIFGGVRRANGWQPYFWQGTVGDTFGGPLGYVAEFALPQGGVVSLPVDASANLEPMISQPIGTWRVFEAPPADRFNAQLDYMWHPSVPPSAGEPPVFFGKWRMRNRPEILFAEWDATIAEYSSTPLTTPFPADQQVTAVGVVGGGSHVVARVSRPGAPTQTILVSRTTGAQTPLAPPPGYADVAAYGVQKGTGWVVCQCNHLLRGTSDLFIYERNPDGNYTARNIPLLGSISVGFSIAPPVGPTGRLFSQIKPDFALPALDPAGLPTSIVFKPLYCRTDLTGDDQTTTADLTLFLSGFGSPVGPTGGDYDNDGTVTTADLVVFLSEFACRPPA